MKTEHIVSLREFWISRILFQKSAPYKFGFLHLLALHLACLSSQLDCVELLLPQPNICVDAKDHKGYTPLIYACKLPNSKYAELLLEAGANPNARGDDGTW